MTIGYNTSNFLGGGQRMQNNSFRDALVAVSIIILLLAFVLNPAAITAYNMQYSGVLSKQLLHVEYAQEFKAIQGQMNMNNPGLRFEIQNDRVKTWGSIVHSTWSFYPQLVDIDLITMRPQTPSVFNTKAWASVDVQSGCAKFITVYTHSQLAEKEHPNFPWEAVNYTNTRCQWNVNLPDLPREYQWIARMAELTYQVTPTKSVTKTDLVWNLKSLK